MAEYFDEKSIEFPDEISNASVGGEYSPHHLLGRLKKSFSTAKSINIIVSFLMVSGVRMLLKDLREAVDRDVKIRILTGSYLGITEPAALALLKKEFGDSIQIHVYTDLSRSFHPKAYLFVQDEEFEVYVGSSNLSRSALTSGIEWNYRLSSRQDEASCQFYWQWFRRLFEDESVEVTDEWIDSYSRNWKKPKLSGLKMEEKDSAGRDDTETSVEPRGAQIEALYGLEKIRNQGADKALVQAATGIGKTYLAAFDSIGYKRALFVAHRQEILQQAQKSFSVVRPTSAAGFFGDGIKDTKADIIFASVQTLGQPRYLNDNYFSRDAFDYIVIDEFHHGVGTQYKNILNYFKPKFLLGLTATPQRLDGKNIYELCDYNVAYEIDLFRAIQQDLLVPFHYYGIYDDTDYSSLRFIRGSYDAKELSKVYEANFSRTQLIYRHFKKHHAKRALGFCISKEHAQFMADQFRSLGISARAVYYDSADSRETSIEELTEGKIQIIFCVDMFNEGVDIPAVDTVLFLRPTLSPTIFLQQLGRGLRKSPDKEFLTVLDFIGNYKMANKVPSFLISSFSSTQYVYRERTTPLLPEGCMMDFDLDLIDLFEKMEQTSKKKLDLVVEEYQRVEDLLGKVPTREELFTWMDDEIFHLARSSTKLNPFKDYIEFRNKWSGDSCKKLNTISAFGKEFLNVIEKTAMSKVYKMPVLLAFADENSQRLKMQVSKEELLESWKSFFCEGTNWKDLPKSPDQKEQFDLISDKEHLNNILKNPVHFLIASSEGYFLEGDQKNPIRLNDSLMEDIDNPVFVEEYRDIVRFRTLEYYQQRYLNRKK